MYTLDTARKSSSGFSIDLFSRRFFFYFIILFYKRKTHNKEKVDAKHRFLVLQENQEKIVHSDDGVLVTQITATPFFHGLVHFTALAV